MRDVRLTATIHSGFYGTWWVKLTGSGYPSVERLRSPLVAEHRLTELVEDGYAIVDTEHYCEMYDVLTGPVSQYEDARDAAESPAGALVGGMRGDDGRVTMLVDELDL